MTRLLLPALLTAALLLAACAPTEDVVDEIDDEFSSRTAVAEIEPINGGDLSGRIVFEEMGDYVLITGTVGGLTRGKHGFHIHEGTSCSDRGGHFNPEGSAHGSPNESVHHLGDLGNLVAEEDPDDSAYEHISRVVSLSGPNSVVGHALVVHQNEDEYIPQPSGSSGPEIGCGIIQLQDE